MTGIQDQQILITSNDCRAFTGQSRRQHDIVIAVATNRWLEYVWFDEREGLAKQPEGVPRIYVALMELPSEDVVKLVEERLRGYDDVLADTVLQQVGARPTGHSARWLAGTGRAPEATP